MGGMFSTAADLTTVGQSILTSSHLAPSLTRQWLKPVAHTADLHMSVGTPWEIYRMQLPLSPTTSAARIVDLYTKNGDLGAYSAVLALSPDHGMGWAIMLASRTPQTSTRNHEMAALADTIADALVPAFEAAAREQAEVDFAGTYVLIDGATNVTTTMTIALDGGRPGMGVTSWTRSDGLDLLKNFALVSGVPLTYTPSLRLYPMGLEGGGQVAFRGVYETLSNTTTGSASIGGKGLFTTGCVTWGGVGSPIYGNVGFDDFMFDVDAESGMATAVTPRVARAALSRKQ